MSTDLTIPASFGNGLPTYLQNAPVENELGAGVQGGYGLIGYRGKVWSIKYRGSEIALMRPNNDGPRNSIEIVFLRASPAISKIYYKDGFVEGSNSPPDCFSTNGIAPDPQSTNKQANTCAACPHNVWGARITPSGKKGKACSDNKRTAVVPMDDLTNNALGGPMLLRVPAASLQDLSTFGAKMADLGYPTHSYAVKVSFDVAESYPKFVFQAIRPLTPEEYAITSELRDSAQTLRILAEAEVTDEPVVSQSPFLQQVTAQPVPTPPAAPPAAAPTPVPTAPPPVQPVPPVPPPATTPPPPPASDAPVMSGFGVAVPNPAQQSAPPPAPTQATPPQQEAGPSPAGGQQRASSFEDELSKRLAAFGVQPK